MEKNFALSATKNNSLTLVLSEKIFLNETKKHTPPPPLQVKWSFPKQDSQNRLWSPMPEGEDP